MVAAGAEVMEPEMAEAHMTYQLSVERGMMEALNGPYSAHVHPDATLQVRRSVDTGGVERWRTLVAAWFPADKVDEALAIIQCESEGDPTAKNPVSSASGLWQFLKGWWLGRWSPDTVGAFDPFDPVASMRAAAIV